MTLAAQITSDVDGVFFNTADFAVAVTYRRGSSTVAINAIVDPIFVDNDQSLGITRVEARSYLIQAADLVISGSTVLPLAGDKIVENGRTYIVPKAVDRPRYEYVDENRLILRVYTTFLSE